MRSLVLLALALLVAPVLPGAAQGFGVYEQGACTMARAGAAVALPCADGSAVHFNPAGLSFAEEWTVSAGQTLITASGSFVDDFSGVRTALDNDPIPVPHLFLTRGLDDRLAAGLGVYVPYGLSSRWPRGFDGAFEGWDNELESIYIQPTLTVRIAPGVSVGGGPVLALGTVELDRMLDLSAQSLDVAQAPQSFGELGVPFHTAFASARLESQRATGFGAHLGIRAELGRGVHLGLRYLTSIHLDYTGTARFQRVPTGLVLPIGLSVGGFTLPRGTPVDLILQPLFASTGPLATQSVETELSMPSQLVAGIAWERGPVTLLADVQWTGWSAFDEIPLRFERLDNEVHPQNFRDTRTLRAGIEYTGLQDWTLRAGALTHGAAAPDRSVTPLLPEAPRDHVTVGVGRALVDGLRLDLAYQYLAQDDRRGRTRAENNGIYTFGGHLFGVTLSYRR